MQLPLTLLPPNECSKLLFDFHLNRLLGAVRVVFPCVYLQLGEHLLAQLGLGAFLQRLS
jgi:hypothetical protein